jgi:hypothetical protein
MVMIENIDKDLEDALIQWVRREYGLSDDVPVKITSLDVYVKQGTHECE